MLVYVGICHSISSYIHKRPRNFHQCQTFGPPAVPPPKRRRKTRWTPGGANSWSRTTRWSGMPLRSRVILTSLMHQTRCIKLESHLASLRFLQCFDAVWPVCNLNISQPRWGRHQVACHQLHPHRTAHQSGFCHEPEEHPKLKHLWICGISSTDIQKWGNPKPQTTEFRDISWIFGPGTVGSGPLESLCSFFSLPLPSTKRRATSAGQLEWYGTQGLMNIHKSRNCLCGVQTQK